MPLRLAEPAAFSVGKGDTAIRRMGERRWGKGENGFYREAVIQNSPGL
jgi:hypothetical protein